MTQKTSTKQEELKKRVGQVLRSLKKEYPDAHCALIYNNPFQLLIATILSAQCTDVRVNKVTPGLFKKYPTVKAFAEAPLTDIEEAVKSTGFYRNKAKSIKFCSRDILELHGGEVPNELEKLVKLRGVGRKTANVVLGNAFNIPGMVVDTHIGRLSYRFGFSKYNKEAVKVEQDLMKIIPKPRWTQFCHEMIYHGRALCEARTPKCTQCPMQKFCPKIGVTRSS